MYLVYKNKCVLENFSYLLINELFIIKDVGK